MENAGEKRPESGQKEIFSELKAEFSSIVWLHNGFGDLIRCVSVCVRSTFVCNVKNRYAIWNFQFVSLDAARIFFTVWLWKFMLVKQICVYLFFLTQAWTCHINNVEMAARERERERAIQKKKYHRIKQSVTERVNK